MPNHKFIVEVDCDTIDQAHTVMNERLNVDEDYGFPYTLGWSLPTPPKIELMVVRDPDSSDDVTMFVDGVETTEYAEEHIDPGAGYSLSDWNAHTESVMTDESYSPAFREKVAEYRDEFKGNQYIEDDTGDEDEDEEEEELPAKPDWNDPMIQFWQEPNEQLQKPWPVIVLRDGSILYGRPDANFLSGFGPQGVPDITVFWKDALADPEKAVGLCPVFVGPGGKMFGVDLKVTRCVPYKADQTAISLLAEREMEMRAAWLRIEPQE